VAAGLTERGMSERGQKGRRGRMETKRWGGTSREIPKSVTVTDNNKAAVVCQGREAGVS